MIFRKIFLTLLLFFNYLCGTLCFMIKIKKILSLFLLALYVSYYASTILFSHTHTISGATIVHSHIHADSHHNSKSGGHTKYEITLIAQISHFEYINFSCDYIPVPTQFQIHDNKIVEVNVYIASIHLQNLSLRAPPVQWV